MEIDFYRELSGYTITELLIIVAQPDKYQPEAVQLAEQLLQQRGVTQADREEADR